MKRTLSMAGLLILFSVNKLAAQSNKLNWSSSFSPAWSNGNQHRVAPNVGGNAFNCNTDIDMHGGGIFTLTMGTFGVLSPSVAGAVFTVPGSSDRLQLTPNFNNKNAYTTLTLNFSNPVSNISFRIADIDKEGPNSTTYFDRVTITGSNSGINYNPTISKYDPTTDPNFLVISGNTATVNPASGQAGNADSDATDQRGTITVNFGSVLLTEVTIVYDNAPGVDNNPATQSIAIGEVLFNQFALPVTLSDFSGHRDNSDVVLNWVTQQEINSSSFEIERSRGNNSWEKIGLIQAAGNSSSRLNYSYRDFSPQGSILLYRLKQVDIDDRFKYSAIVRISNLAMKDDLKIYPNPARDRVSVGVFSSVQQSVLVQLSDPSGKIVVSETRNLYAGENNILLSNLGTLSRSVYHLVVTDTNGDPLGSAKIFKQ